jgi:membrane-anchored protein YejM (alkaline phosphatase superfamily)
MKVTMKKKYIFTIFFSLLFCVVLGLAGYKVFILKEKNISLLDQNYELSKDRTDEEPLDRPNIVLIHIDSLRADHMGIYGYDKNTTPFLDSMFKKGVIFENAIAAAPFSFQDDAVIFSGLYPSQNNVTDWNKPINKDLNLLPKILSFYGYRTFAQVSPSLYVDFEMDKSFGTYTMNPYMKNIDQTKFSFAKTLEESKEPFFGFWHIYDVHLPYFAASAEFYPEKYNGSLSPLSLFFNTSNYQTSESIPTSTSVSSFPWSRQTKDGLCIDSGNNPDEETCKSYLKIGLADKKYIIASYDTSIKYTDAQLAQFFDLVKDKPFYRNTLFIISAEHGEDLGEHGLFFHGDIYNNNIHIPLAIIYPKLSPKRIKENVSNADIMPTILTFTNIPLPQNIEGKDLSTLIKGEMSGEKRQVFSERAPFDEYTVIKEGWKYITRDPSKKSSNNKNKELLTPFMKWVLGSDSKTNSSDELYNLSEDFYEQNNLIGKGYEQEKELQKMLQDFKNKMWEAKQNQPASSMPPQRIIPYP